MLIHFISNALQIKKLRWKITIPAVLILITIFSTLHSCSIKKAKTAEISVTNDEKVWLTEFFRDLLFKESGAFTLYGTKPVSIYIFNKNEKPASDEEIQRILKEHPEARLRRYDFNENYKKWLKIKDRFHIRQYLFGVFKLPFSENQDIESILFVNIEMTLRALLKYYDNFRSILGYDFDPFQVVFDVENRESIFWNAILKHHALTGILLGFGVDNSWFFEWKIKYSREQGLEASFICSLPSGFDTDENIENYGPQSFELPVFRVFGIHQGHSLVKQYEKERKQIKKLYKGNDEVDVALQWLTR